MSNLRWQIAQWFELRWWQRYLSGKDKAQYYAWKRKYWNDLLAQIADVLPYKDAGSIADVGCGPAGIFIAGPQTPKGGFNSQWRVTAVDPLLDIYEKTLSFFDKEDFPYTTFLNQKLEDFQPLEPFNIVFCMNAINHVADIDLAYDRLIDATKKEGFVVVSIDAHNHSFFKKLFRLIPGDILHPHQYDLQEYCDFMTKRGCTILKKQMVKREFFFSHYLVVGRRN
jgi:2-polyprenyl-6-hydroxyphenyl methylase/3-demethylubiquinone-9 3-methyltransferase